jgi:tRNA (guanosine-2'-O-)-methyltransferase
MACTPTGPELCFNASDDNCNGIFDEGCGVGTGLLQFEIAWADPVADVDLIVTEPSGVRVFQGKNRSPSGLQLDKDCPGPTPGGCHEQNVENVFFEGLDPPRGHYVVEVRLTALNGAKPPIAVHLGARVGRAHEANLLLSAPDDRKTYPFDL